MLALWLTVRTVAESTPAVCVIVSELNVMPVPPVTLPARLMLVPCKLTPPLAVTAPDTVDVLLFVKVKEPLPSVTELTLKARPD